MKFRKLPVDCVPIKRQTLTNTRFYTNIEQNTTIHVSYSSGRNLTGSISSRVGAENRRFGYTDTIGISVAY